MRREPRNQRVGADPVSAMKMMVNICMGLFCCLHLQAQTFRVETVNDSLSWLILQTDSTSDRWQLPYPVYQFQVGDVDGNGVEDAVVGVIKKTRFHRELGRRLFIFKNYRGHIRPLWMGSKLGGELVDFRFVKGQGARGKEQVSGQGARGKGQENSLAAPNPAKDISLAPCSLLPAPSVAPCPSSLAPSVAPSLAPCPSSLAPTASFIRALERGRDGRYAISDYRWEEFGMVFDHFIETNIESKDKAYEKFTDDSIGSVDIHDGPSATTR